MSKNGELISGLQKLVDMNGPAQVSVWLGMRDARSVGNWLSTKNIPRCRVESVQNILKQRGLKNGRKYIRRRLGQKEKTV